MIPPEINRQSLKLLAYAFKLFAIFVSVVVPLWIFPAPWGAYPAATAQTLGLVILALVPNRCCVFSRTSFVISLLLALFPFRVAFQLSAYKGATFGEVTAGLLMACILFLPLPVSFILSRERYQRGEKFIFA
jgi:hypothetical protein